MLKKTDKPEVFSALEVANICGVVNQTAINWIKGGHLKAFTTPGGQYRVYPDDLASFMKGRKMRIPEYLAKKCTGNLYEHGDILIVDDDKGLNCVIAKFLQKKYESFGVEIFQAFDRFVRGQIGLGVLKLLTGGGCVIWALVDWIIALIKAYGSAYAGSEEFVFVNGQYTA